MAEEWVMPPALMIEPQRGDPYFCLGFQPQTKIYLPNTPMLHFPDPFLKPFGLRPVCSSCRNLC